MKTYILGAGSSYEFGYPLGKDIFPKAQEMAYGDLQSMKSGEAKHLLRAFENVEKSLKIMIEDLPGCPKSWPNFEEIYTFIDHELSLSTGPRVHGVTDELKKDLKTMLFHMISECGFKPFIEDTDMFGKYAKCISNIVEDEPINIISFNYDVLLPNALKEIGITPYFGYKCFDCDDEEANRELNFGERIINIALPHGAVYLADCSNCNKRYLSKDPITASIDNMRANCPECSEGLNDNFLILPSYIKDIEKDTDAKRILGFISQADEIFIAGYSFPPYDYYTRVLFMIGLSRNPKNPTINIIDVVKQEDAEKNYSFIDSNKYSVDFYLNGFYEKFRS